MIVYVSSTPPSEDTDDIIHFISPFDVELAFYKTKVLGLDIETTGLDPNSDEILLIGVGDLDYQIIINTAEIDASTFLYDVLEDRSKTIVGTNLKFDLQFLMRDYSLSLTNLWDTARTDEVIFNGLFQNLDKNPTKSKMLYYKAFSLKSQVKRHLHEEMSKEARNTFIGRDPKKPFTPDEIRYLAKDVTYPLRVREVQKKLIHQYNIEKIVELENGVVEAVAEIEFNGVRLDEKKWAEIAVETEKLKEKAEEELDSILIKDLKLEKYKNKYYQSNMFEDVVVKQSKVNWDSDKQVLDVLKTVNSDIVSTSEKELSVYKNDISLINKLLTYKELSKSCNTYGLSYLKNINPKTKRIHPSIEQLYPATGRVSVLKPNLQQVKRGSDYRSCFIATEGCKILGFDYSNQELRIIAAASGDPLWIDCFKRKGDLHSELCQLVFDISADKVKEPFPFNPKLSYREVQKTIDFMLAYGGSEHKLASVIGTDINYAKGIILKFFKVVPKVEAYLEALGELAVKGGYARTLAPFGRIRWFKDHANIKNNAIPFTDRKKLEGAINRAGKNTPIQGTGADMMKLAMKLIIQDLKKNNLTGRIRMILQVHDELLFECSKPDVLMCESLVKDFMLRASKTIIPDVPMEISCKIGDYWQK